MTVSPPLDTRVSFTVNGQKVSVAGDHPHLLAALRDELNITSAKDGCSPSGQCGCCTIMIDGKAQVSCQYSVAKAEGKDITTLEGVDESERKQFADAFAACGGLQCGFCIPGIVMRAKSQIDKKGADLKREDMARHLGAHLCRCTGYVKVLDAIEAVAQGTPVDVSLPGGVGSRGTKYEASDLALGDRGYVDDIRVPGMLHGALHLTSHVRADILSIDTSAALAAPGVTAVFTAADVPGDIRVGIIYKDWPVFIGIGERTSYAGDVLAIVVAATRREARAAAELIQVQYNVLRPIVDAHTAITDSEIAVAGTTDNVLSRSEYLRGDVDAALKHARLSCCEAPGTREPWVCLALLCYQTQNWPECYAASKNALSITNKELVYTMDPKVWTALPHDLCSLAAYHLGLRTEAIDQVELALAHEPTNPRLLENYRVFKGKP